jgi:methionine synthase II (cobalamin-independent)
VMADSVLKPVIDSLDAELVVLSEPFLGRVGSDRVHELAQPLGSLGGGPKLALQLTFCDAREALENGLAELPVDGIGVDFYATHLSDLPKGVDKLVLAGIVDARSSTVEDERELAEFAQRLQDDREIEQIALVPNGDLQFVAQPIALDKLRRLGAAKTATVGAAA